MRFAAAIFDFDDTLVHLGVDWDAVERELVVIGERLGRRAGCRESLMSFADRLACNADIKREVDEVMLRHERRCVTAGTFDSFPGMVQLATDLHAAGMPLAVVSSNSGWTVRQVLARLGISAAFPLVCGREALARTKPNPDPLLHVLSHWKVPAREALFIGDSESDAQAASAAGVPFFLIEPDLEGEYGIVRLRCALLK